MTKKKQGYAFGSIFFGTVGGIAFGSWMDNFAAGFWMALVLMLFSLFDVRIVKFKEDDDLE
jgi:hypothetical protein